MRRFLALALAALTLTACASMNRALSFGNRFADARYTVAGKTFSVWVHPSEDVIMLQSTWGDAAASGFVEGATLGLAETDPAYHTWMAGARYLAQPAGCEVRDLRPVDQDIHWEFDYSCPEGVDLRALIMAQRDQLRHGAQITP